MTTFKYFSKVLLTYFATVVLLGLTAILIFLFGSYHIIDNMRQGSAEPTALVQTLISHDQLQLTTQNKKELDQQKVWLMLLSDKGEIEQSYRLPDKLNRRYSMADIARSSRWYLDDYPVFNFVIGEKILILGYPKGAYAKFPSNYYNIQNFFGIAKLVAGIVVGLILTLLAIYLTSQWKLRKEFKPITQALTDLSDNQPVLLDEKGNLSEIKLALNQTSQLLIENKDMRSHWIRGISHDLRNPLTLMLSYTSQLESLQGRSQQTQQIEANIHKMESIISNLNMSYLLESPDIEQEMTIFDLNSLLRQIIADLFNSYDNLELTFELPGQATPILGTKTLLTRAINNILLNSLTHNISPQIKLSLQQVEDDAQLIITDNGSISAEKIQELNQKSRNYDTHGMGIIISKQIVTLHKGSLNFAYLNPGLESTISLPLVKNEKDD
ncbi:sensor histidine kinase [Streptococcus dentapri]|uniref:histidine kinase n=1 Tax=Streptococcus dentapri TaxID=573564 RepID=A0ABV8D1Z4_9STRE